MTSPTPTPTISRSALRYRKVRDRIIEALLLAAGLVAVFTTLAIVAILLIESRAFFEHVSLVEFLTDTMWTPLFADAHYGILPLVAGTLTTTMVALLVAMPLGHDHRDLSERVRAASRARDRQAGARAARRRADRRVRLLRADDGDAGAAEADAGAAGLQHAVGRPRDRHHDHSVRRLGQRRRDARRAALHARRHLRDGRDALADRDARRRARRVLRHWPPPSSSASRARSARRWWSRSPPACSRTSPWIRASRPRRSPRSSCRSASATCRTAASATSAIFAAGLVLMLMTLVFNIAGFSLTRRFREAY